MDIQQFEDAEKLGILRLLHTNAHQPDSGVLFDDSIDRRKYSYVMTWCREQLDKIDNDTRMKHLLEFERMILTDDVDARSDKALLRLIRTADPADYNFMKLYDLGFSYRHYLQIRLRSRSYKIVDQFIRKHRTRYEYARRVHDKMNEITTEIADQYKMGQVETHVHEQWLYSVFNDEGLDGQNRVLAWIRILFISFNYRRIDRQGKLFDEMESKLKSTQFYSRRLLANFYSQLLLYHASLNDAEKAIHFGYLSIKVRNSDYVYYVNNLAAILLRAGRPREALDILLRSAEEARVSPSYHNKIGHAAYLIMARIENKEHRLAESRGDTFYQVYKKEILEFRWHLFMTNYLRAILINGNYKKLIRIVRQSQLLALDAALSASPNYTPVIPWLYTFACFKEGSIGQKEFMARQQELLINPRTGEPLPASVTGFLQRMSSE